MELNAENAENPQGDDDGDGDRHRRHSGHVEGEEEHGHPDDREDGDEKLLEEDEDRLLDGGGHIGDPVESHLPGKGRSDLRHSSVNLASELDDVVPLLHLQGEDQAPIPVALDVGVRIFVLPNDPGHVLEAEETPGGIGVDDLLGDLFLVVVPGRGVDGHDKLSVVQVTGVGDSPFALEGGEEGQRADSVMDKLLVTDIEVDLLGNLSDSLQLGDRRKPAEFILDLLHVLPHLPVAPSLRLQGEEDVGGFPEIVAPGEGDDSGGELPLQFVQAVAQLCPDRV